MDSYGLELKGPLIVQKVATLPTWAAADEGRLVYALDVDQLYLGNNAGWVAGGGGGGGLSWGIISTNTTAESGNGYLINATSGVVTLTLPASPSEGDAVGVCDYRNMASTNTITIARNSSNIEGAAEDLILNVDGAGFTLVYTDSTRGWEIVSEISASVPVANSDLKKYNLL